MTLYYGDIVRLKDSQYLCKVVGTYIDKCGKEYYELQPLVNTITMPRKYIENECEIVKENGIGIELEFNHE